MPFNRDNWTKLDIAYYEEIDRCALKNSNEPLNNSNPKHAVYLINKLLVIAKNHVRIFSDSLISTVKPSDCTAIKENVAMYGNQNVIQNAMAFLSEEGTQLDIVVEKSPHSTLLNKLYEFKKSGKMKGTLNIRQVIDPNKVGYDHHFMVADNCSFRIEKDPNHTSFQAFANFGDFDFAKKLNNYFDDVLMTDNMSSLHTVHM